MQQLLIVYLTCETYRMSSHYLPFQSRLSIALTADHLTRLFALAAQFKLMFAAQALMWHCLPMAVLIQCHAFE